MGQSSKASGFAPLVCTLTEDQAGSQLREWSDLQKHCSSIDPLPRGVRLRMPSELEPAVADLAEREAACCAFLDLSISTVDDEVVLEITSQNPDAIPVIHRLAGLIS